MRPRKSIAGFTLSLVQAGRGLGTQPDSAGMMEKMLFVRDLIVKSQCLDLSAPSNPGDNTAQTLQFCPKLTKFHRG